MLRLLFEAQTVQNFSLKEGLSPVVGRGPSGTSFAPSRERGDVAVGGGGGGGGGAGGVAVRGARRARRGSVDMTAILLIRV